MLTVLLGGARSGKSTAAVRRVERSNRPVCFIATSPRIDGDTDLDGRIASHRGERPTAWRTVEVEVDLAAAIVDADDADVIIDCLTVWVGNLMHHGFTDEQIDDASNAALAAVTTRAADVTVVTNEVGMGIVPGDAMSRRYRDALGRINQQWVDRSDRAHFIVAGRAIDLTDLAAP